MGVVLLTDDGCGHPTAPKSFVGVVFLTGDGSGCQNAPKSCVVVIFQWGVVECMKSQKKREPQLPTHLFGLDTDIEGVLFDTEDS